MYSKKRIKMVIDFIMTIFIILLMGYSVTGNLAHEIIGIIVLLLFTTHCFLNRGWFISLTKDNKKKNRIVIFWNAINIFLIADFLLLGISSIIISKAIFSFTGLYQGYLWVYIHNITAYGGFIIISLHLGLHWKMIMNHIKKVSGMSQTTNLRNTLLKILAFFIAFLGVKASYERSIASKFIPKLPLLKTQSQTIIYAGTITENIQQTGHKFNSNNTERTFSEVIENDESEDDFLSRLTCTGCGRQCFLSYPACSVGVNQAQAAKEYYHSYTNDEASHSSEDSIEQDIINDEPDTIDSNLSDYLGTLFCDGCHRHCSLLAPQCATGTQKAEIATQQYYLSPSGNTEKNTLLFESDDDSIAKLFLDYIPIMGLYIAGSYYTLKFIKKKNEKRNKKEKH